jgi:hypothetical protein
MRSEQGQKYGFFRLRCVPERLNFVAQHRIVIFCDGYFIDGIFDFKQINDLVAPIYDQIDLTAFGMSIPLCVPRISSTGYTTYV